VIRALLVDDESTFVRTLTRSLERGAGQPRVRLDDCRTARAALARLRRRRYDAVLLDWVLDADDGLELATSIRKLPSGRNVALIMLTGRRLAPENEQLALRAGLDDFLRKPFDPEILRLRLAAAVERASLRSRGAVARATPAGGTAWATLADGALEVLFDEPGAIPITYSTSGSWCGAVLKKPSTRYDFIYGTYHIPFWYIPSGTQYAQAAPWVGMGGYVGNQIIQDGMSVQAVGSTLTQQAWYEYFPDDPVFNTNMVLTSNNVMYFEAWEGNSSCQHGAGDHGYGCFWYEDYSTGVTFGTQKVAAPPGTNFGGATAEAIMEKWPSPWDLAGWYGTHEDTFFAEDSNGNLHDLAGDPYVNLDMINDSDQDLCTAAAVNSDTIGMTWDQGE
jgi:CheY-like chemotaxis protein